MSDTRYRQFRLINAVGEEYDMCHADHLLLSPDGLGFKRNISAVQVGSAFAPVENNLAQQVIKGEMRFRSYEHYSEFEAFIASSGLTLAYQPKGYDVWYYRNVEVERLDKSEIDSRTRRLICPVDFFCFSQWYEKDTAKKTVDLSGENVTFPLVFPYVFSDAEKNELLITNGRVSPAPCKIIIVGPCVNPAWTLKQNGKTILTGAMTLCIASGEKLIVDANIESMKIVKAVGSVETDVYQYSDFSTARFLYAPAGISKVKFTHTTAAALDVTVEVRQVSDTV